MLAYTGLAAADNPKSGFCAMLRRALALPGGSSMLHKINLVSLCHVPLQDTVIYERLAENSRYKEMTLKHLELFATEGERVFLVNILEL